MAADGPQPPHVDSTPPRRRRWQFGLSTLLLLVTACAVLSWWYARQEPWEEFQQRFTLRVRDLGGEIEWGTEGSPTRLSFRYWGFSDAKPLTDERLKGLRRDLGRLGPFTLNLSATWSARGAITDQGLKHLDGLLRLECLDLRYTEVTDEGLEHLARLKGLQFVDLRDTRVSDRGIRHALEGRPELVACGARNNAAPPAVTARAATEVIRQDGVIRGSRRFLELVDARDISHPVTLTPPGRLFLADADPHVWPLGSSEVLLTLHDPISDSGAYLARIDLAQSSAKMLWSVFAEPLGVAHSKYRHVVQAFDHGDRCVLVRDGAETVVEIRDLATGALLKRWVY